MVIDYRRPGLLLVLRALDEAGQELRSIVYLDTEDGCCIASNGFELQKFQVSRWWLAVDSLQHFFSLLAWPAGVSNLETPDLD